MGDVMWLTNSTRVFGVTPAQMASTTSSGLSMGTGRGCVTIRDPRCSQTKVQVRSRAPYSWSVVRISSPGASGNAGDDIQCRGDVVDVGQVVGIGMQELSERAAGLGQQAMQASTNELDRLELELALPGLIALENGRGQAPNEP